MLADIVPVIMAGIIGIYGLVVSVLISDGLKQDNYALYTGFIQLGAGLAVGLAGMAAGFAIGIVGDAGVRGTAQQPRLFVGMILILIFAEVLGKLSHPRTSDFANSVRSLRSDRCAAHELQGHHQHHVLNSALANRGRRMGGQAVTIHSPFLPWISTHAAAGICVPVCTLYYAGRGSAWGFAQEGSERWGWSWG